MNKDVNEAGIGCTSNKLGRQKEPDLLMYHTEYNYVYGCEEMEKNATKMERRNERL